MQPHEVLGVPAGAGPDEVAAAFRRFAKRHHPDRGGDPARFQEGLDAYHRLTGDERGSTPAARADVVFHRRPRGLSGLLRRARRGLARSRP